MTFGAGVAHVKYFMYSTLSNFSFVRSSSSMWCNLRMAPSVICFHPSSSSTISCTHRKARERNHARAVDAPAPDMLCPPARDIAAAQIPLSLAAAPRGASWRPSNLACKLSTLGPLPPRFLFWSRVHGTRVCSKCTGEQHGTVDGRGASSFRAWFMAAPKPRERSSAADAWVLRQTGSLQRGFQSLGTHMCACHVRIALRTLGLGDSIAACATTASDSEKLGGGPEV